MAFITRLSLRLGVVVLLGVALLFGAGIFAATQVQQDLLPDISVPAVIIITPYPGASPEIVDQQVSVPIVNAMLGVTGTTTVQSTSSQGASLLIVLFRDGTDIKSAEQDVNSAMARIRQLLPPQAASSSVQTFSTNSLPILEYAISADEPLGDLAGQLRAQALPKLKGLAGVSSVVLTGAPTDEVDVTVDPSKLAAHGLTVTQVAAALQQASIVQSIGSLKNGSATIPLQVSGSLTSLDQIGKVTVNPPFGVPSGAKAAAPVTINQLGTVQVVSIPADTITRTNGKQSIGLQIVKGPNTNTVTVANEVWNALPGIESSIGHGVRVDSIQDQATPITQAIGNILREGLLGAVFAVLVIFVFLRSVRATVVAAISIPLSLLVALIALWTQGITLNILTLGGMMVAIGRVVDDSIVVLENISRHVSEGERPLVAAYTGAREIITAVSSSTLTTVAVFLPIVFLTGIAGSFFRPFARLLTLGAAAAFFAASMALIPLLRVNLLDQSSSPTFPISITMPVNSTLSQTDSETQKVEALIAGVQGITAYQATVGGQGGPFAGAAPADPSQGSVLVLVENGQYDSALAGVKRALNGYQGPAKLVVGQAQNNANASTNQMVVDVRAGDTATLQAVNDQVLAALSKVSGLAELKSNLVVSKPQYQLVPTDKLAASGLNIQTLAALVAQQINGQVATQANLPQGSMIVRVQLPPGTADTVATLSSLPIPTAFGVVPLSTIATIQQVTGPQTVNRVNGDRDATITGTITANDTRAVQSSVTNALAGVPLPSGASLSTGGVFAQLSTVLTQFALALLAAIGLVYLIMVATFRSLLKPLVLLVAIPFAATGAIIALVVTNTSLSLPGLIGILMLTGIVVTNAIVLLDLIEQYRDRGLDLHDAIIEGGRHRLRPILMTAFATMLALAPLAVIGGGGGVGGAFISGPLAIVVIGGLFTSTVLTLVLVPVLYSLASRFASRRSTKDLDELLDAAEDRRFKPLGYRAGGQLALAAAGAYAFSLTLEPEPGRLGDPNVLEVLTHNGLTVEPVAGTAKMRIGVPAVQATSPAEASAKAVGRVRGLVPATGYTLSEPEPVNPDGGANPRQPTKE